MPKMSTYALSTSTNHTTGFLVENFGMWELLQEHGDDLLLTAGPVLGIAGPN